MLSLIQAEDRIPSRFYDTSQAGRLEWSAASDIQAGVSQSEFPPQDIPIVHALPFVVGQLARETRKDRSGSTP